MRWNRRALGIGLALAGLLAVGLALASGPIVAGLIDRELPRAAKEFGMPVRTGEVSFAWRPAPTLVLHRLVAGSEERPLATVERLEVRPRLLPLVTSLGRRVVIDQVVVDRARVTLRRDRQGRWAGLPTGGRAPKRKLELQRIVVRDSAVSIGAVTLDDLQATLVMSGEEVLNSVFSARLDAGAVEGLLSVRIDATLATVDGVLRLVAAEGEAKLAQARWTALDLGEQLLRPLSSALARFGVSDVKPNPQRLSGPTPTITGRFFLHKGALIVPPFTFRTPMGQWRWAGRVGLDGRLDLDGALMPSEAFVTSLLGGGGPSFEIPLHLGGQWNAPRLTPVDLTTTARRFVAGTVRSRVESQGRRLEESIRKRLGF